MPWWEIIIVCLVFGLIIGPVDRFVNAKVSTKSLAIVVRFVIYVLIFMALYCIADLIGIDGGR